ncbi:hypothetical protein DVU_0382 [Nitratidesulfovibrio vulgaris str. Hildenborough]|uniref:Uncharacterized protein n=1 Tax=Nitratidesulfovibrio vulgaris (strain ATCC 29579 / DSM 644 / CCUG 34227 / NCIMB 8303 / VKM B-1760 / Hildenborough) TaxID=882 RepID=Q72F33_NITV2|nr:hypothetical protein DVU_0382 [Nitratidesulfovibrio vulgaris str. Hildenborough]
MCGRLRQQLIHVFTIRKAEMSVGCTRNSPHPPADYHAASRRCMQHNCPSAWLFFSQMAGWDVVKKKHEERLVHICPAHVGSRREWASPIPMGWLSRPYV